MVPTAFPVFFVGMWLAIGQILARSGGWHRLALRFRALSPYRGERLMMCSGRLGHGANYNSVLTLGANPDGLYLAVFFLFRSGHPPLFIPRSEIRAGGSRIKPWIGPPWMTLHLGQEEDVALELPEPLARQLLQGLTTLPPTTSNESVS